METLNDFLQIYESGDRLNAKIRLDSVPHMTDIWAEVFERMCENGELDIVTTMIEKGMQSLEDGLCVACEHGHTQIAEAILAKKWNEIDYERVFECACEGGHLPSIGILMDYCSDIEYESGLISACINGHIHIIQYFLHENQKWYRGVFDAACEFGQLQIAELMIKKGVDDWALGIESAAYGGNLEIVKYMYEKGVNKRALNNALEAALVYNDHNGSHNLEVIKYLVEKGACKFKRTWRKLCDSQISSTRLYHMIYIMMHFPHKCDYTLISSDHVPALPNLDMDLTILNNNCPQHSELFDNYKNIQNTFYIELLQYIPVELVLIALRYLAFSSSVAAQPP